MPPVLPGYDIIEQVYQGSNTIIYRARHTGDGVPVMIKALRSDYPTSRQLASLRHEYETIKNLDLPGVVHAYELKNWESGLALILEDFGGQSLSSLIETQRIDLSTFLQIGISLTETLGALHEQSIIHKDIKPQNILINTQTKQAKIIDFGIATRLSQENQIAGAPHMIEGTLAYMSPEQTGRMNRVVDYRTDFYSLGITFYEMLTSQLPFSAADSMELIHSHIARMPTPPHTLIQAIPQPVSDIVMKLLAKATEDRYQSANGIKADLQECLNQWQATGSIQPFPLAQQDVSGVLRLSQKLYGRDLETATLLNAFDRVSRDGSELLLVSGYSGIGKTALVNEVHKPIARQHSYFISGKFDQYRRNIPYTAIIQAFQDLIRQLFAESTERLDHWKELLSDTLGGNGQILINVIPDIELLLGAQPPVPQLGPTETRNRFNMVLQQFIGVFTRAEQPLVIFLDDMQWADLASLQLLQMLITDPDSHHLLIICAYRDNEVNVSHPLMLTLGEIRKSGAPVNSITLQPLALDHINQWLADTLGQEPLQTLPLAQMVQSKTGGNPFFMNQFLRSLHQERLLSFHASTGRWRWNLERIRTAAITDNVVELMANNIRKLSPTTQHILQLAACIGNTFDLEILSVINEKPPIATANDLWEAIKEGLIIPLDADYRLLSGPDQQALGDIDTTDFHISYKFLHDRVQQAAYALIAESETRQVHLTIGRLLLQHTPPAELNDKVFDIVNQFNIGFDLIDQPEERLELAQLNLFAGQKARASAAYESAVSYLSTGIALLPADHWESHYKLSLDLHQERSVCEYLTGNVEAAEALFDTLLAHTHTNLERASVYMSRTGLYTSLGRFPEGLEAGRQGLALFGIIFPDSPEEQQAALGAALGNIQNNLGDRQAADLLDAPQLSDPEKKEVMYLLAQMITPAFNINFNIYALIVLEMVNTSLQYGNTDGSAFAYCTYGMLLCGLFGDYQKAESFGRLGLDLNERYTNAELQYRASLTFGSFIDHWRNHVRSSTVYLRQAYLDSIAVGDVSFAGFPAMGIVYHDLGAGINLTEVLEEARIYLEFLRRSKNEGLEAVLLLYQQVILCLQGQTKSRTSLSDELFDEETFVTTTAPKSVSALASYYVYKAQVLYIHEDYLQAFELIKQGEQMQAVMGSAYTTSELVFYSSLIRAAVYASLPEEQKPECWAALERNSAQMQIWAENGPENSGHRYVLLLGEMARLRNEEQEAISYYDQAVELATSNSFTQNAAIANELAAQMFLSQGKRTIARAYMIEAYEGYLEWGAIAKADLMVENFPAMLAGSGAARRRTTTHTSSNMGRGSTSLVTLHQHAGLLDVTTVIKGAQIIAGEIMLDKLLDKLMNIVVENAGAQKGLLILHRQGQLKIEAAITPETQSSAGRSATDVDAGTEMCVAIVQYVARSLEPVVLHDATLENRFANDPYIITHRPRSVLCLPLIHQGNLTGILYLENNLATNAFNAERVELLSLLSLQGAIAIENALLYADIQEMTRSLQQSNEQLEEANRLLEDKVSQRTEELSDTNTRLQQELIERQRAEEERVRLQEKIIQVQASALAELSTPLIPLTDSIMVMPLIGTMDSQRAQQVLESLLQGISERRATVVIIDITGVPVVDTAVAGTLVRAAQAVRFLGTQTVITGIRPEVAQTLVGLGVDLGSVITLGTLQTGIAYALSRSGEGTIANSNGRGASSVLSQTNGAR